MTLHLNLESLSWQDSDGQSFHIALGGAFMWLDALGLIRATKACKSWASLAESQLIGDLPAPQLDAVLQFCLLEVLYDFDDARLPLPMSAIYGEMCHAGRRAFVCHERRTRLEASVFQMLGPANRIQQATFLRDCCPHHVYWALACREIGKSGYKSLEKFGKHFHTQRLIEHILQRWQKRIHHSRNTRSCMEWLLTKVNREHALYLDHQAWRKSLEV